MEKTLNNKLEEFIKSPTTIELTCKELDSLMVIAELTARMEIMENIEHLNKDKEIDETRRRILEILKEYELEKFVENVPFAV